MTLTIPVNDVASLPLRVWLTWHVVFSSPLPNPQLWAGPTLGYLQSYECFAHGGWWHDPAILSATGEGLDIEEPRAWEGWWNEAIVGINHRECNRHTDMSRSNLSS